MVKLSEVERLLGGTLIGDPNYEISGVADLLTAQPYQATFLDNPRYRKLVASTRAGLVLIHPSAKISSGDGKNWLLTPTPSCSFQKLIELFQPLHPSTCQGIHPTAIIDPSATLESEVTVGPYCTIGANVVIRARCHIEAGCHIGADVTIGMDSHIHARVVIESRSKIGDRVIIQPGAVIGSTGFGYHTNSEGEHKAYAHLGYVILEDDVEIGANTTIDRGRFDATIIGKGTKIDNLVQIGHQVRLGKHNLIVAQVGIAGSTSTGNHVVMGGQVGVAGHLHIGDRVIIAACSGVSKSLNEPDVYYGSPAMPSAAFKRLLFSQRKLPKLLQKMNPKKEEEEEDDSSLSSCLPE